MEENNEQSDVERDAHETSTSRAVEDTLTRFFAEQTERERFVSTQRIPFICTDIRQIKSMLETVVKAQSDAKEQLERKVSENFVSKERFRPIELLVFGFAAVLLTGIVVMLFLNIHK